MLTQSPLIVIPAVLLLPLIFVSIFLDDNTTVHDASAISPQPMCHCPQPVPFGRNCSVACCATPGALPCPALPHPNPWTCMSRIPVPGAIQAGALYPDGRPAEFELNLTDKDTNGWMIHLSGGGWRFMKNSSTLNSAEGVPPLTPDGAPQRVDSVDANACGGCYGHCDGILSTDASINPLFHNYNKVFVPISGTSFTGNRDSLLPYPVRGARILQVVIHHLQTHYRMDQATDIILTGGSSGGLATFLTCDRVGDMIRAVNASTRYSCLADAGFFLDHPTLDGRPSTSPLFEESFYAWNSTGGTNQDCIAYYTQRGTPEKCMFAQYVVPFIRSPLFILQNLYDSWQLENILQVTHGGNCGGYGQNLNNCTSAQMAAIQAYGQTMRGLLLDVYHRSPSTGTFAPSCIAHCQSVYNEHPAALWEWFPRWSIAMHTPRAAFDTWYQEKKGPNVRFVQQCDWGCNVKCPLFT